MARDMADSSHTIIPGEEGGNRTGPRGERYDYDDGNGGGGSVRCGGGRNLHHLPVWRTRLLFIPNLRTWSGNNSTGGVTSGATPPTTTTLPTNTTETTMMKITTKTNIPVVSKLASPPTGIAATPCFSSFFDTNPSKENSDWRRRREVGGMALSLFPRQHGHKRLGRRDWPFLLRPPDLN